MNSALELHDSEVSSIDAAIDSLRVLLSAAYVHRSNGVPGLDSGDGYVQAVELVVSEATWSGVLGDCIGRLSDGTLVLDGKPVNLVPLPFAAAGKVDLALQFSNGSTLAASGKAVHVRCIGEARFVERFSC